MPEGLPGSSGRFLRIATAFGGARGGAAVSAGWSTAGDNAPKMKRPWLLALLAGLSVLLLAMAWPLWHMARGADAAASGAVPGSRGGLPWQVRRLAGGGSEVMGLQPGRQRLAEVQALLGDGMQLALVARVGEVGALEALVDPFAAGFVSGRLVLAFDAPPGLLRRWREEGGPSEAMAGGLRRFALTAAQRTQAAALPLVGLTFVPGVALGADDIVARFGAADQRLALAQGGQLLLYPALGLAAAVQPGARPLLQYVAPADFERRLRPLAAAASSVDAPALR